MSEFEIVIPIESSTYNEAIIINKYGDKYSLVAGYCKKDDKPAGMRWCYPQNKERAPGEKAVPWGVLLGNRTEAIDIIKKIGKAFGLEIQ